MQPEVFATCDIGAAALDRVRAAGIAVDVHPDPAPPPADVLRARVAAGLDGLITTLRDRVDDALLAAGAPRLRVVSQIAVGLDNIDVAAATRRGVVVTHTPDVLTGATAEFALFALGALARRLTASEALVREGRWTGWHPYLPFLGDEVGGMTIGVVGVGRIGRAFAARCVGLDVDLLLHDRKREAAARFAAALQAEMDLRLEAGITTRRCTARAVDLAALLGAADAVSLHVPLRPDTERLIDAAALRRMKPVALLVNTARGAVVDEAALVEALRAGRLGGVALDVFDREPLPADSPLRDPALRPRVLLTHHFASGTTRTRLDPRPDAGMAGRCVAGLLAVLRPAPGVRLADLPYVANPEAAGP